jgi:hypothetical protein
VRRWWPACHTATRCPADAPIQYVVAIAALGADFALDAAEEIAGRVRELGRRLAG